jgi:chromosome segregation protein
VALDACRNGGAAEYVPGVVARASELVSCDEAVRPLVRALLGDVLVVEGPDDAEALREMWPVHQTIVTRDGEVYDPRGLASAGPRAGGPGLLSRRAELKKLEAEIEEFLKLIAQKESRRAECGDLNRASEARLAELRQQSYEKRIALGEAAREMEQVEKRRGFLTGELDASRAEARQIEAQRQGAVESAARVDQLLSGLEGMKEQLAAEAAALAETQQRYEGSRGGLQEELTGLQVARGALEEKRRGVAARLDMVRGDMQAQEEAVRRGEGSLADLEARVASVVTQIDRHQTEAEALAKEIEARQSALDALQAERNAASERSDAAASKVRETEGAIASAQAEAGQLAVQRAQQEMTVQQGVERAREELGLDLAAAGAEPQEEADWEALAKQVQDLRSRIDNFGVVNLVALSELQELEDREKRMLAQVEDLEKGKLQLEELIRRINKESKELFDRTLEFVREQFHAIFRKVFGGGKADIVLQEEPGVDAMDQGLEVIARMPQRESLPISMLSGGQKSLTAFSLVMALFKANPSPFCILDEADAPLDESNVDKYTGIVTEFVAETQFIIISHNKRTMAIADVLYGVTMETPGVSKKVSVDLHGQNLEVLRDRREKLKAARAEAAGRKQAALAEVKAAAAQAIEIEDRQDRQESQDSPERPDRPEGPGSPGDSPA